MEGCWGSACGDEGAAAAAVVVDASSVEAPTGAGEEVSLLVGLGGAKRPVVWIMEPSLRERMRVDWTPGREVRWERRAETCCGICGDWWMILSVYVCFILPLRDPCWRGKRTVVEFAIC